MEKENRNENVENITENNVAPDENLENNQYETTQKDTNLNNASNSEDIQINNEGKLDDEGIEESQDTEESQEDYNQHNDSSTEIYSEDISDDDIEEEKVDNSITSKIKSLLDSNRLIYGSSEVAKSIKNNKLEAVIIASNLPDIDKEQFKHYCDIAGIDLFEIEEDNEQLALLCKKPFNISVLGIIKE